MAPLLLPMHLIELLNSGGVLTRAALPTTCLLLAGAGLLSGCSGAARDSVWRSLDPLGYSRANDAPYLYRKKSPDSVEGNPSRPYHLDDPF